MTTKEHNQLLDEFICRINKGDFFDAHESLEVIWFPRRFQSNNEMKLLKGFINAAVSFELLKRGRVDASKRVWKNYLKYKILVCQITSPHLSKYHLIIKSIEFIYNQTPKTATSV